MIRHKTIRSQRIERRNKRAGGTSGLNLTSMMDIFTILVFFLMVNSSTIEVLPSPKSIVLPESVSSERAEDSVVVMVTKTEVLVNGESIISAEDLKQEEKLVIPALKQRLNRVALLPIEGAEEGAMTRGKVNVMADKQVPYHLIKKIIATAADARFAKVSLAVIYRPAGGEA
ncbi:MAG: ExbD/TolR family protein [Panacagrimonas sp.]